MADSHDYSYKAADNSHYSCPSMYGKLVKEQYNMQPKYAEPGSSVKGSDSHRNVQKGP